MVDGLLINEGDDAPEGGIAVEQADTMMHTIADKVRVARAALDLAQRIGRA